MSSFSHCKYRTKFAKLYHLLNFFHNRLKLHKSELSKNICFCPIFVTFVEDILRSCFNL